MTRDALMTQLYFSENLRRWARSISQDAVLWEDLFSDAIVKAFEKYSQGASQSEIAKFLFVNGITKRKGGVLSLTTVEKILREKTCLEFTDIKVRPKINVGFQP